MFKPRRASYLIDSNGYRMDASMVARAFDQINQNFVLVRVATFRNDIDQVGQPRKETVGKRRWRTWRLTLVVSSVRIVLGDWHWRSLRKSSTLVYWFYLRVRPESNSSPNSRTFPFLDERSSCFMRKRNARRTYLLLGWSLWWHSVILEWSIRLYFRHRPKQSPRRVRRHDRAWTFRYLSTRRSENVSIIAVLLHFISPVIPAPSPRKRQQNRSLKRAIIPFQKTVHWSVRRLTWNIFFHGSDCFSFQRVIYNRHEYYSLERNDWCLAFICYYTKRKHWIHVHTIMSVCHRRTREREWERKKEQ